MRELKVHEVEAVSGGFAFFDSIYAYVTDAAVKKIGAVIVEALSKPQPTFGAGSLFEQLAAQLKSQQ